MAQAGFSQEQAAVDMPHTTHVAIDVDQPDSQANVSSGSSWQVLDGALDANQYQYQQIHDTVPTPRSAWDQTTDESKKGPDTYVDEPLSSKSG